MNFIQASIFILLFAVISTPIANRFSLPLEIFLVLGSALIGFIPGLPEIHLDPHIVFSVFLPPILFSAGYFTSLHDLKHNFRPISLLAIGLIIFTTICVAIVAKWIFPGFTWAEGFLLGAIISPSDAAAASAIIKKLGVTRRFGVILEGESLFNDATALILYRFSLAAIIYGSFSLSASLFQFFFVAVGGIVVGLSIAYVVVHILRRIKDLYAETICTIITAFMTYLVAEHLDVSGVIATVAGGIYFGIYLPEYMLPQTRMNAIATWRTLIFAINGFVFTLIGFELPYVLKALSSYSLVDLLFYGLLISVVVILLRLCWIFIMGYIPHLARRRINKEKLSESWQFFFLLGWTGMRGIVSLAAVLAIPRTLPSGSLFPNLDLIVFITYSVVIVTLILPTFTIPFFVRRFRGIEAEDIVKEEAVARLKALEKVRENIIELAKVENIPANLLQDYLNRIEIKHQILQTQTRDYPYSSLTNEYVALNKLTLAALQSEREILLKLRRVGEIHDEVFHNLLAELDLDELRARSLRL